MGYGFIAMLTGLMLSFFDTQQNGVTIYLLGHGSPWWNYPGVLVIAPGGVIGLPCLATITMGVVSSGVGLGMTAGVRFAALLLKERKRRGAGAGVITSLTGLTPAMIALLTLGACCSTTAAAAAGIGAVAQASGTTYAQLVANAWYLNVFQVGVLGVALVAQEQLLTIYGTLPGAPPAGGAAAETVDPAPRRTGVRVGAVRAVLLATGTIWALSALLGGNAPSPSSSSSAHEVALGVGLLLQKVGPGLAAIAVALVPASLLRTAGPARLRPLLLVVRGGLLVGGMTLAFGVPPPLTSWGFAGLGNELLGAAGYGVSDGGVLPPSIPLGVLALSWLLFYVLLGGLAIALAVRPGSVVGRLAGVTAPGPTSPAPTLERGNVLPHANVAPNGALALMDASLSDLREVPRSE
ncbi:MAG: hypothetical protein L3J87_05085 [Thermoplasmata archaeon]|nr:hypothetical protein [Thermoplasmata archaeon]